jgi:hypothetical protein
MTVGSWVGRITVALAISLMATLAAVARNTAWVKLTHSAALQGKQLAPGEYQVAWKTHSPGAIVTLTQNNQVIATVPGSWVDRDTKYEASSVVYSVNPDGSRTVLEIRFAGRKGALVFGDKAAKSQLLPAKTSALANASATSDPAAQKLRYLGKPRLAPQIQTVDPLDSMWGAALIQQKQPIMPPGVKGRSTY